MGIAIRHSQDRIIFYTAGSGNGLEGKEPMCPQTRNLENRINLDPKITKIKVSTFWMSGNRMFSRRRPMPACSPVSFKQFRHPFRDIWPRQRPHIQKSSKKCGLGLFGASHPKVKSPKMGLPMDPHYFLKRSILFRDVWPR